MFGTEVSKPAVFFILPKKFLIELLLILLIVYMQYYNNKKYELLALVWLKPYRCIHVNINKIK